jgi:urease accessory protein
MLRRSVAECAMLQVTAPIIRLQRARGRAQVALERKSGGTRLAQLFQEGSAKAFLPAVHDPVPEVVFLNTAGGLTGGDRLSYGLTLGEDAVAVATTQTAERAYASGGGRAEMAVSLSAGPRSRLEWLPQETILFDGAALDRRSEIDLATDAECLLVETVVLGRAAMGEQVLALALRDVRVVRRNGRPDLVEPLVLDDESLALAGQSSLFGGARAYATIALLASGAEDAVPNLRKLRTEGVEAGVSGWNGKCVLRVLGRDAWPVRRHVAAALDLLRRGRPLPRVWRA